MATATTEHELSVIIAGAGSTGLLVAQVLKKVGIACTVYEADPTPTHRPRDWNFGIYWAQSPLGNCLPQELNDQLTACQVDIHTPAADDILPVLNGKTGEVLKEVAAPFNLRLQRRKFIQLLGTGIDIQYGKRLVGVESGNGIAKAKFEDGSEHTANLLIGAEGAHSVVRNFLCGPEKGALKESPLVANATICRLPAENALAIRKLHHRSTIWFHPNNSFTWFGVHNAYERDNPEDWEFMFLQSWKEEDSTPLSQTKILQDMKTRADDFADPYKSCVYAIAEGTKCWRSRLKYWPTEPWDNLNGTVTLAGDAAHPMTFHRGQGLNNAISDAASFLSRLEAMPARTPEALATAVKGYEEEMWVRGREAVLGSNENSLAIHDWSQLQKSPLFTSGLKQKIAREED